MKEVILGGAFMIVLYFVFFNKTTNLSDFTPKEMETTDDYIKVQIENKDGI